MAVTVIDRITRVEAFRRYLYSGAFFLIYATAYSTLATLAGTGAAGWLNLGVQGATHLSITVTSFSFARLQTGSSRLAFCMVGMGGILGFIVDIVYNYSVNILAVNTNTDILDLFLYHLPFILFLIVWIVALVCFLHASIHGQRISLVAMSVLGSSIAIGVAAIYTLFYSSVISATHLSALPRAFHIGFAVFEAAIFVLGLLTVSLTRTNYIVLLIAGLLLLLCHDLIFQSEEITAAKRSLDFLEISWTLALLLILLGNIEGLSRVIFLRNNQPFIECRPVAGAIKVRGYFPAMVLPFLLIIECLFAWHLYRAADPSTGLARERYIFFAAAVLLLGAAVAVSMLEWSTERALIDHSLELGRLLDPDVSEGKRIGPDVHSSYMSRLLGFEAAVQALASQWRLHKNTCISLDRERVFGSAQEPGTGNQRSLCFVLMPFTPTWSRRVYLSIGKAAAAVNLDCRRADEIFGRDVIADIWRGITSAAVVVADLSGRNANVLYEVGIGHTLGKPMVLLAQSTSDIPFDLATRRVIIYNLEDVESKGFRDRIEHMLRDIQQVRASTN